MKLDAPKNNNYAATIIAVGTTIKLEGLDYLVGVPALGHQALTNEATVGDLRVCFTSETQLSEDYAHWNNLYRHADKNRDESEKGYLEENRRVRALKLRGHVSNALLMPLSSLAYTGVDVHGLQVGDVFDSLGGHDICKKYEIPRKYHNHVSKSKIERAFRRVDEKLFPEHLETDAYWRNKHLLKPGQEVVITQKIHGTSWRGGNVPVRRRKSVFERFFNLFWKTPAYEYAVIFGSRKVIKDPNNPRQQHFYQQDIWTRYGQSIAELIPEGYVLYGELVGWTPDGSPLQKGYTYHVSRGEAELYVYRVAHINGQGYLSDLSWDGVKEFCRARGLKWVPELFRAPVEELDDLINNLLDERLADLAVSLDRPSPFADALPLSDKNTVDEGFCIRQEGLVPLVLKAKSPEFLAHETRMLDSGEADLESVS